MSEKQNALSPAKDPETGRFLTGNIGGGRPLGSRNKLAEAFLTDVLNEWETHGAVAISDMREKSPGDFCKMVASLCPKEMTLNLNDNFSELSDDELLGQLRTLAALAASVVGGTDAGSEAPGSAAKPSQLH
jgi:hypothetical protein